MIDKPYFQIIKQQKQVELPVVEKQVVIKEKKVENEQVSLFTVVEREKE